MIEYEANNFNLPELKALMCTGHRPSKVPDGYNRNSPMRLNIRKTIGDFIIKAVTFGGINTIISGMALGFDQDVAHSTLELKKRMGGDYIRLIAAVPFKGQEILWKPNDQDIYHRMLKASDAIVYVCDPGYAAYKMQKRNEWMVNMSTQGICLWNGSKGGTYNCIQYAKSKGLRMFNLLDVAV